MPSENAVVFNGSTTTVKLSMHCLATGRNAKNLRLRAGSRRVGIISVIYILGIKTMKKVPLGLFENVERLCVLYELIWLRTGHNLNGTLKNAFSFHRLPFLHPPKALNFLLIVKVFGLEPRRKERV